MNKLLVFIALYVFSVIGAIFVLFIGIAGGHYLYFSGAGGTIAIIISALSLLPFICFLLIRRRINKFPGIIIAFFSIALIIFSNTIIYIGVPTIDKEFIIRNTQSNKVDVVKNNDISFAVDLNPEMFKRVGIDVEIQKDHNVEISNIQLRIIGNDNIELSPVFKPIAWDSLQYETEKMDSFFELNRFTKSNKFFISTSYPIEDMDSIIMNIKYLYSVDEKSFEKEKTFKVDIINDFLFDRLIRY